MVVSNDGIELADREFIATMRALDRMERQLGGPTHFNWPVASTSRRDLQQDFPDILV